MTSGMARGAGRLLMCIFLLSTITGLTSGWSQVPAYTSTAHDFRFSGLDYEPYAPEEFPEWAHVLRRYETIFFGSLPFSFLFSSLGFDFYAYAANNFDENYLPLFLGTSPEKEDFNSRTIGARVAVSITLSMIIAYIDYLVERDRNESSP